MTSRVEDLIATAAVLVGAALVWLGWRLSVSHD